MRPTDTIDKAELYRDDCMYVLGALETESCDSCVTDPPYGMSFQSNMRVKSKQFEVIANDDAPFVWWLRDAARVIKNPGCLVCFCRWDSAEAFRLAIGWAGLKVQAQLIWDRKAHGMGNLKGSPAPCHDTIWFATKGGYKLPGDRPASVYSNQRYNGGELVHSNQKPEFLMADLVKHYTPVGGKVLDPFLGSGSTGVAAIKNHFSFVGIEINEDYYETAKGRIESAAEFARGDMLKNGMPTARKERIPEAGFFEPLPKPRRRPSPPDPGVAGPVPDEPPPR